MTRCWLVVAGCILSACVSTSLEVSGEHPASPEATPTSVAPSPTTLDEGFEPFEAYGLLDESAASQQGEADGGPSHHHGGEH